MISSSSNGISAVRASPRRPSSWLGYGDERRSDGRRHHRADRAPDAALRQAEADRGSATPGAACSDSWRPSGGQTCSARSSAPGWIANFAEGQQVAYRFLLAESTAAREQQGIHWRAQLLGSLPCTPPPRASPKWGRCARWIGEFGALWHSSEKFDRVGWMLRSIEYSWPEKLRFNRAAGRSFALLCCMRICCPWT